MTGLTAVRLGDVARIQAGIGFPIRLQGRRSGRYPFAKVGDISRRVRSGRRDLTGADHWVDESDLAELRVRPLPAGAVVFAKIGEAIRQNFRAITTVPSLIDNNVIGVIAQGGVLDTGYLYHFLCATDMYPLASATTVPAIRKSVVENIRIPLPAMDEQRRIVAILDQADALRAKRREALAHLDDLTQSNFLDMFGDSSTANGHDWDLTTIGAVADIQGGLTVNSARKMNPIEVPYLRVANVHRGRLELAEVKTLRATEREIDRTRLQLGDFLVVEGHGNADEIGRGALWDGSIDGCVHQNHLIRVRFDRRSVLPVYGSAFINSQGGRRHLLRAGKTTSGLNTISVSDVRSTPIVTPPVRLQKAFVHRLDGIRSLQAIQQQGVTHLNALFASLQSRAFAGKL